MPDKRTPKADPRLLIMGRENRQDASLRSMYERFTGTFSALRVLGKGAEGEVLSATTSSGKLYAVKGIEQSYKDDKPIAHNEVRMLLLLANIGKGNGRDMVCLPGLRDFWFAATPTPNRQAIVLEHAPLGTLRDYLCSKASEHANAHPDEARLSKLPAHEGLLRHLYKQMVEGLAFCHYGFGTDAYDAQNRMVVGRLPIIHRDLKGDNILVFHAPAGVDPSLVRIKLSDFGGAAEYGRPQTGEKLVFFTPGYIAPEFMPSNVSRNLADLSNDVYAIGATMYWCVFGSSPNPHIDYDINKVTDMCLADITTVQHQGDEHFSPNFSSRVTDALAFPDARQDALAILERLTTHHHRHIDTYLRWMADVETPRLAEAARRTQEERQARARAASGSLAADVRTALRHAARQQCYRRDCCDDPVVPHTHVCEEPACAAPWGHAHALPALVGTVLDPGVYIPEWNRPAMVEDLDDALRKIRKRAPEAVEADAWYPDEEEEKDPGVVVWS